MGWELLEAVWGLKLQGVDSGLSRFLDGRKLLLRRRWKGLKGWSGGLGEYVVSEQEGMTMTSLNIPN